MDYGRSVSWCYPANYTNCIADPTHWVNCLAVHIVHTVPWTQGRQGTSYKMGSRLKEQNCDMFILSWRSSCSSRHAISLLLWLTQWTQPWCRSNQFSSVQFSLLASVGFCDPKDCSMSGLPVRHQFLEFTQIHVHWVGDAFQPSHPLSSPSPPTFHLSQHQGLFQWVSSSHQVAKVLEQH